MPNEDLHTEQGSSSDKPLNGIRIKPESFERVTGRKARGLQMEEIGFQVSNIFYLSLKWQEETTSVIFFLLLYTKRFLLK